MRISRPELTHLRRGLSGFQFEGGRQTLKWIALALIIGAAAGLGAILCDLSIIVLTEVFLTRGAGFDPPNPEGEGSSAFTGIARPWLLPLIVAFGGFLSGLVTYYLSREAAGGGNEHVILSYHYNGGEIRKRVGPVKLLASAITVGSGGSAGREGPMAQISASFGATVAELFRLTVTERRICVLMGMGAGIGAIFRAPLGGAVLATEILYREDMEADAAIPVLISSIVSYSIFSTYAGWDPLFSGGSEITFREPVQLIYFAVIGVLAGLLGIAYSRTYYGIGHFFSRMRAPALLKPPIGGLLVGLIAIKAPQITETGYGWVQRSMDERIFTIPLWILLLLPLLKILTTSLTVNSGGSGGVFGPGIFIGAMLGAGFWRVFHDTLPGMPDTPASFTIIGMVAHFGSIAHVPLAVMIMVAEMTRNLTLLAPAMVAVGIATFVVGNETIFRSQVANKSESPVHRHRYAFPLLASLTAGDAMRRPRVVLRPDLTIEAAEEMLHQEGLTGAPVVDDEDRLVGVINASDIASVPEDERASACVRDLMHDARTRFDRTAGLDEVFDSMANDNLSFVPVVDQESGQRLEGVLNLQSIIEAYRRALAQRVRRTDAMMIGSTLFEVRVTPESPLCRVPVRDLNLPEDALLVSYTRGQVVRFPHGDTVFEPGDRVSVVTSIASEQRIRRFLESELMTEAM